MKNIIITSLLIVSIGLTGLAQQKSVTINGTVTGNLSDTTKIYFYHNGPVPDSTIIKNGTYSFTMPFKEDGQVTIVPDYIIKRRGPFMRIDLLTDKPGSYTVNFDSSKKLSEATFSGSATNLQFRDYLKQRSLVFQKIEELIRQTGIKELDYDDELVMHKYDSLAVIHMVPFLQNYIAKNPDSYVAAYVLSTDAIQNFSQEQKKASYAKLSDAQKKTRAASNFSDYIEGTDRSALGQLVADFKLKDPKDQDFSFSDLKGKYLIVDFWASWCGPCRQSFPHIRSLYQRLKGPQFEILSISIDKSKSAWMKAVQEENNPWPQVLDTQKIAGSRFAVTAVPTMYLIGPDGKILMKEIGYEPDGNSPIEKKLLALFPNK